MSHECAKLPERALAGWGFEAAVARSAEEALRATASDPADIIVLDLNLPGMDGMELLTKLRERTPGIQAIVLTGFASVENARQAVHLDVVEFLTKPCHLGELEKGSRFVRCAGSRRNIPLPWRAGLRMNAEGMTLQEVERQHILAALERHNGNRTATAAELGHQPPDASITSLRNMKSRDSMWREGRIDE